MLIDEVAKQKEKEKRDGLIGTVEQQGACRFCGQLMRIETMIGWDEEKCDELATEKCECIGATRYAAKKNQKEKANEKIDKLFVNCKDHDPLEEAAVDVLRTAVEMIVEDKADKCSLETGTGIKAKISITSKYKIKVERTDTEKAAEEA